MDIDKPKRSGWLIVNIIIAVISVCLSLYLFVWTLSVCGLFPYFFIVLLVLFILIPVFYRIHRKNGKCLVALWIVRIAFVLCIALYAVLPFIGIRYEHDKNFYVLKKFIYNNGVYIPPSDISEMLPKHLPDDCREYKYKTQLGSIAQDYHPSEYLMFYTDSETISDYERHFNELPNCVRSDETVSHMRMVKEGDKYVEKTYLEPKYFPDHAFSWLDDVHREEFLDMRNAAVYRRTDTYYTNGCLIDYDSGLVVFWT